MSENQVNVVETKIEDAVKAVEVKVEDVVKAVEGEVKKVVTETKETFVRLTTEEKLILRELEVNFLKIQQQATQIETQLKEIRNTFQTKVEEFTKKYLIDKALYVFDGVALEFRLITQDIKKEL